MKIAELKIGKIMLLGVIFSASSVLYGGMLYLLRDGQMNFQKIYLSSTIDPFTLHGLYLGIKNFDPKAYVLLGVLILVLTQLLRVVITAWVFLKNKETFLFVASTFVFLMLAGSFFVHITL
jgi:uncharacterized membrane protein